ncbi:MAG: tetratricopeptide repeat protein [Sedimentisphaerales bacterium]|nr:tetratricopeptide repeat protein [Sedimentisphaerales bacterium]
MKMRYLISFIIVHFLFITASCSQNNPDTQPKSSLQREQEEIEARWKRSQRPEAKAEREMLDNLKEAMDEYYKSKDETSRKKYESLYKQALKQPKPSAAIYSACATAANLLDQPKQAIKLLKKAIAEYPDERVWGPVIPLKVSGYYRIGSIASRMNDPEEATEAYETVIRNCKKIESTQLYQIFSLMHLVDIASNQLKDKKLAVKRLKTLQEIIRSVDKTKQQSDTQDDLTFIRDWISYEQELLDKGKAKIPQKSDLSKEVEALPYMLAILHANLSQPGTPELELNAKSDRYSIDSILNKFAMAFLYMHDISYKRQLGDNPPKVEKYLQDIIKTDSFFKPYAEAVLDLLQEQKAEYQK